MMILFKQPFFSGIGLMLFRCNRCSLHYFSSKSAAASISLTSGDYKLHRLESGPSSNVSITRDQFLKLYRDMRVIREMENEARKLYLSKKIRGFCHLYSGQEACAVGIEASITSEDPVITAYRVHGWAYTRGVSPREILAEVTGRATGCSHGKGGSMHLYGSNFYGGNGIVGAQVPIGAGIALALKYNNQPNVCVCVYGDGAANQGQVFEAFNMASLWKLPVVFVCENNRYGMGTAVHRSSASTAYYTRGDYIPGIYVDGMDVLAVREATHWAKEYILAGNGPLLMELDTYRYYGHSMSDPGKSYRKSDEVSKIRKERDPLRLARSYLSSCNLATEEELNDVDKQVKVEIREGVEFALSAPPPDPRELYTNVYKDTPIHTVRGCDPLTYGDSAP